MDVIEFYTDANGSIFYRQDNRTKQLTRHDSLIIGKLNDIIKIKYVVAWEALGLLAKHIEEPEYKSFFIASRFIRCNFGNDDILQFDIEGDAINVEDVRCPLRGGHCKWENIICRSSRQLQLTDDERHIIRLLGTSMAAKDIAAEMKIEYAALRKRISRLKSKLGVKNCTELLTAIQFGREEEWS